MELRLGERILPLDRSRVMGILNVTPDSFSDGGRFLSAEDALSHAQQMVEEGADIIDVGGESTRPGADELPLQQELDRVIPVIESIANRFDVAISIDTSKPAVMQAAVAAGAVLINDIFALQQEGALEAAAKSAAAVCLMHMQGTPRTMQQDPHYEALPGEIIDFLAARVRACRDVGIDTGRLVVDPGFGFGKDDRHNLKILANLDEFRALKLPLLVGLSRKRTLGNLTGRPVGERQYAGAAAAAIAVLRGAHIVRTHDVAATADAVRIAAAVVRSGNEE